MAVEAKRGCGFRKVGGLYLVSGKGGMSCCKLPMALHICPTCSQGIKQSRGWTWVDPSVLLAGDCTNKDGVIYAPFACPASNPDQMGERAGLLWIGKAFYKTPAEFNAEAAAMGVSRRISAIPHDFVVGQTWVLFAHPEAVPAKRSVLDVEGGYQVADQFGQPIEGEFFGGIDYPAAKATAEERAAGMDLQKPVYLPGIFRVFMPERIERIVKQSEFDRARAAYDARAANNLAVEPKALEMDADAVALLAKYDHDGRRGITWIPVPDDDKDHQGSVHDAENGETA